MNNNNKNTSCTEQEMTKAFLIERLEIPSPSPYLFFFFFFKGGRRENWVGVVGDVIMWYMGFIIPPSLYPSLSFYSLACLGQLWLCTQSPGWQFPVPYLVSPLFHFWMRSLWFAIYFNQLYMDLWFSKCTDCMFVYIWVFIYV